MRTGRIAAHLHLTYVKPGARSTSGRHQTQCMCSVNTPRWERSQTAQLHISATKTESESKVEKGKSRAALGTRQRDLNAVTTAYESLLLTLRCRNSQRLGIRASAVIVVTALPSLIGLEWPDCWTADAGAVDRVKTTATGEALLLRVHKTRKRSPTPVATALGSPA